MAYLQDALAKRAMQYSGDTGYRMADKFFKVYKDEGRVRDALDLAERISKGQAKHARHLAEALQYEAAGVNAGISGTELLKNMARGIDPTPNKELTEPSYRGGGVYGQERAKEILGNPEGNLTIPTKVASNARLGLELHKQFGRGGTDVGLGMARKLARGGTVGEAVVKKVGEYFPRHAGDRLEQTDPPSNGYIAWLLWGGDEGWEWSKGREHNMGYGEGNPSKPISEMSGPEINRELDKLDKLSSQFTNAMIDAGRGYERYSEWSKATDALARKGQEISDRQQSLRIEVERRYGPGAPSRLPKGFGPIKRNGGGRVGNPLFTSDDIKKVLPAYAKIVSGAYGGHIIIRPKSNLKPLTTSQTDELKALALEYGFKATHTDAYGKPIKEGYGFRLYRVNGNPGQLEEAQAAFESFHGYHSSGISDVAEHEEYRDELAQLATMEELEVLTADGKKVVPISFDHHTKLCVSPDNKQLYLVGGNQELDLDALVEQGVIDASETEKDLVTVGPVKSISYFARKTHLQGPKKAVAYIHEFGEEDGVLPELVYDVMNKRCSLAGGSYDVEDVGIKN